MNTGLLATVKYIATWQRIKLETLEALDTTEPSNILDMSQSQPSKHDSLKFSG